MDELTDDGDGGLAVNIAAEPLHNTDGVGTPSSEDIQNSLVRTTTWMPTVRASLREQ